MLQDIDAFIFDLGGTLINYEGFPIYWGGYYDEAFKAVSYKLNLNLSEKHIKTSTEILKNYNPRINPREFEYNPRLVFSDVIKEWDHSTVMIDDVIESFFQYFQRNVCVFPDTVEVLEYLKDNHYKVGVLTDMPTGMPTELIIRDITTIKDMIDLFLSSVDCGFRKPNKKGLEIIANSFGVNLKNIVYIGDEEKDIKTAKNAGAVSILINREKKTISYGEDIQINSLSEIKWLLYRGLGDNSVINRE
ncbi:HAD family hydrolase [Paenibacillus allorhizosphaerae]|uniref:Phosphoglycolate phosphatase n=1 Tax=Paenibacillus allorhizosphaerae TaxID=2849866 RepID=A0ABM8VUF5_9BACL|nr:HAD family hydrolase [Paenibacillus allorhizosphaerae]CAG7658919.1 Phosphoglycolate phosphatase [Paenibacillus allorhizosphaerae]